MLIRGKLKDFNSSSLPFQPVGLIGTEATIEIDEVKIFKKGLNEELYPCDKCGRLRTKAQGGTTFTICEECWDKNKDKQEPIPETPKQGDSFRWELNQIIKCIEYLMRKQNEKAHRNI